MTASVSFVIPVLNEERRIAVLLRDLRTRFPRCELVVVDGGSEDATVDAATPYCDLLLHSEPGRAAQMNLGAGAARSDYLFFLHADSRPQISAAELDAALAGHPSWGFCRVRLDGGRPLFRVIEWFMNQRSRLTRIATGDQMLFVDRALFDSSGGFDAIPLMEDVAYCKRLRRLAAPAILAPAVVTSSRRWEEGGALRTILLMWSLRLAYFLGVSPATLWRHYYGR